MPRLATNHQFIKTNGITLHVASMGEKDRPLVILLHGFPEFWYGWRHQMAALEAAGFRVWVPDQRGYNLSEKPRRVRDYGLDLLAQDIVGLIEAAGVEKAYIAGHDWGAMVAWWIAMYHPQVVEKLVILNVPHPFTMRRFLLTHPLQMLKSWYAAFFQLPFLPEIGFRLAMRWALPRAALKTTFSQADMRSYRVAWRQRGAVRSMINWYRAAFRNTIMQGGDDGEVSAPTKILWGEQDVALDLRMAALSLDWCDDGELVTFPQASHFVQHDVSAEINHHLIDFFQN